MSDMAGDWWYNNTGQNMLAGVPDDPDNPPRIDDELIADLLTRIPAARESFNRIVPTMLPEEQARLLAIAAGSASLNALNHHAVHDQFQHRFNTTGIRVAGPRGGGNWAPPPMQPKR